MEYLKMNGMHLPTSRIIFGAATRDLMNGIDADALLDNVTSKGITTFDTARSYGKSEETLGRWIKKRDNRNQLNILTKGCNPTQTNLPFSPESLRSELEQSLTDLQTDHVEYYALHRDDTSIDVSVYIDTLNAFVQEGKILHFGGSNWTHTRMKEANSYAASKQLQGFTFGSPAFSLAEYISDPWGGSIHLSGDSKKEAREWFLSESLPVFAYSSLARGFFSGKYRTTMPEPITEVLSSYTCTEYVSPNNLERLRRAEILAKSKSVSVGAINLAWILAQPLTICPILSSSHTAHIDDNLGFLNISLTVEEEKYLNLED